MSHLIIYNSDTHIIEIKIEGDFTLKEAQEIMAETAQAVKAENCFWVLNDLRSAKLSMSLTDLYTIPQIVLDLASATGIDPRKLRRAIVISRDLPDFLFFENVNLSRGLNTKLFQDIDEGRKWLAKK